MAQRTQRGKRKDERSTEDDWRGMDLSVSGWNVATITATCDVDDGTR